MSDRLEIPAAALRPGDSVRVHRPSRRRDLAPYLEGKLAAVNSTSVLVNVDGALHGTTVLVLAPVTAITHVWRQLPWGSAPSQLPVTHKAGRAERSRPGWRENRARRWRDAITKQAVRAGGREPSERGTT